MEQCIYCNNIITDETIIPAVDDAAAWAELAKEHQEYCEWIQTRAHRERSRNIAKKNLAQKLSSASTDLGREAQNRPTDKQTLKALRKKHLGWSDEQIANQYGLSL